MQPTRDSKYAHTCTRADADKRLERQDWNHHCRLLRFLYSIQRHRDNTHIFGFVCLWCPIRSLLTWGEQIPSLATCSCPYNMWIIEIFFFDSTLDTIPVQTRTWLRTKPIFVNSFIQKLSSRHAWDAQIPECDTCIFIISRNCSTLGSYQVMRDSTLSEMIEMEDRMGHLSHILF